MNFKLCIFFFLMPVEAYKLFICRMHLIHTYGLHFRQKEKAKPIYTHSVTSFCLNIYVCILNTFKLSFKKASNVLKQKKMQKFLASFKIVFALEPILFFSFKSIHLSIFLLQLHIYLWIKSQCSFIANSL